MSTVGNLDSSEARRRYEEHPERSGPAPEVSEELEGVEVSREEGVTFYLKDGRVLTVPLNWSWRLMQATDEELQNYEVGTYGVHWPAVDEDLSARGALRGMPAPRPGSRPEETARPEESGTTWDAPHILQLRRRLELSQQDLAARMGVRQATVSDWENAKQEPSPMARRLLDMLSESHRRPAGV